MFARALRGAAWHTVSTGGPRYLQVAPVETHSVDLSTTRPG